MEPRLRWRHVFRERGRLAYRWFLVREDLMLGVWSLGHYFLNPTRLAVFHHSYRNMEPVRLGGFYMDGASAGCHHHLDRVW